MAGVLVFIAALLRHLAARTPRRTDVAVPIPALARVDGAAPDDTELADARRRTPATGRRSS